MKQFDDKIETCEKKGKEFYQCKRVTIAAKQEALSFNKKSILWCIHYYLRNHKHAITKAFYSNKMKKYYGIAEVQEPDGKVTEYLPELDNTWFIHQARHGLQDYIKDGCKSKRFVQISQFDMEKKDQFSKLRYHPPSKTNKEGTFTCVNVDNEKCVLT